MKLNSIILPATVVFCVAALALPWAAASQVIWVVEVDETSADSITVSVSPPSVPICGDPGECIYFEFYYLYITPCPLNKVCSGDTYSEILMSMSPRTFLFLAGDSYTFSGNYQYIGYDTDFHEPCNQRCERTGKIEQTVFPGDYVSTFGSTWGCIKTLCSGQ